MNDDLISRKALLERLETAKSGANSIEEQFFFDGVMAIIDTQPTAFNKEKVMSKLQNAADLNIEDGWWHIELQEALGIVERGGING